MLDYRGKKDKWGVGLDLIYLNINPGATVRGPNPAPVGPPIVSALTAMCNAQLTNNMEDLRVLTVHPMGESATGRRARPIFRLTALQLLAIAGYYSSLCLARRKI